MDLNIEDSTVFVRLLEEGTDVMRPVKAKMYEDGKFFLLRPDDYDPEFELWEFLPGSLVKCKSQVVEGEIVLVASEYVE